MKVLTLNYPESYIMFELVQDEYLEQSVLFASTIQDQFRNAENRSDRSVRQAGFLVLRQTTMPSVLVEIGFISNSEERKYMNSENGQNGLSGAIFNAFSAYKKRIEDKSRFSLNAGTENKVDDKTVTSVQNTVTENKFKIKENITYSVQISASTRELKPTSVNFKGVKNVFRKDFSNVYKYFTGSFKSYEEAQNEKMEIVKKFPDAFVVAFKNEELISVKMALEN